MWWELKSKAWLSYGRHMGKAWALLLWVYSIGVAGWWERKQNKVFMEV